MTGRRGRVGRSDGETQEGQAAGGSGRSAESTGLHQAASGALTPRELRRKIGNAIAAQAAEKGMAVALQLISTALVLRFLPREDYGKIAAFSGAMALIGVLNLAPESILLRDHRVLEGRVKTWLSTFLLFNLGKCVLITAVALGTGWALGIAQDTRGYMWASIAAAAALGADILVGPLVIYGSTRFAQRDASALATGRVLTNTILQGGLVIWPSLAYLAVKEALVGGCYVLVWYVYARRRLGVRVPWATIHRHWDPAFLRSVIANFSGWSHMTGVATGVIYRADALVLSWVADLKTTGDYGVALASANMLNVVCAPLSYQCVLAHSHTTNRAERGAVTRAFMRFSGMLAVVAGAVYVIMGRWCLSILTGTSAVGHIYRWMLFIVGGLLVVRAIAGPITAEITVYGSMKELMLEVVTPVALLAVGLYWSGALCYGASGLAAANVVVAAAWAVLVARTRRRILERS